MFGKRFSCYVLKMKTYMDIIWLVASGEISQQNARCRDCKCDSWGANVLWVQKPAVLFCLFFFLPGLTIQFLSAGNVHSFSFENLLSLTCGQLSTSNITSCWEDATCSIFHDCQQQGFINQPVGGAEIGMNRQKRRRIAEA